MKYILVILFTFYALSGSCQVFKYSSCCYRVIKRDKASKIIQSKINLISPTIFIVDYANNTILTHGDTAISMRMTTIMENHKNEDGTNLQIFTALDKNQDKCAIFITHYNGNSKYGIDLLVDILYKEREIAFELRKFN
jgi:hypothetical protein